MRNGIWLVCLVTLLGCGRAENQTISPLDACVDKFTKAANSSTYAVPYCECMLAAPDNTSATSIACYQQAAKGL
jgi:hypothetical protein